MSLASGSGRLAEGEGRPAPGRHSSRLHADLTALTYTKQPCQHLNPTSCIYNRGLTELILVV